MDDQETQKNRMATRGERSGFQRWALVVGSLYALVTLFVFAMAAVRVMAAEPPPVTGYAPPAAMAAPAGTLMGDVWPAGVNPPRPSAAVGS